MPTIALRLVSEDRLLNSDFAPRAARDGSYSPYSNFRVGACLLASDGSFVPGANVENASYGGGICAERTAIVKGVSEGQKRFVGLVVTSDVDGPISPCGICRQVLREFCPLEMPILLVPACYKEGVTVKTTAAEAEANPDLGDVIVETSLREVSRRCEAGATRAQGPARTSPRLLARGARRWPRDQG